MGWKHAPDASGEGQLDLAEMGMLGVRRVGSVACWLTLCGHDEQFIQVHHVH
jgi:hypothetical protein